MISTFTYILSLVELCRRRVINFLQKIFLYVFLSVDFKVVVIECSNYSLTDLFS